MMASTPVDIVNFKGLQTFESPTAIDPSACVACENILVEDFNLRVRAGRVLHTALPDAPTGTP
jgi:hypothetical protein